MLRELVGTFLDSLSEREFDAPLLALLASQGFSDVHFVHGSFEFGKDVIAKRISPESGVLSQYAIQSKAGDIGQGAWREIRPQLEESEYNTRAHPGYDEDLPRIAVLLTTGRLKGSAGVDAQEYKRSAASRGLADFEVWERATLLDWMCADPSIGLVGSPSETDLLRLIADIRARTIGEPSIERYARRWLHPVGSYDPRAAIESAMITHALRGTQRADLAALACIHAYRAAAEDPHPNGLARQAGDAALNLFVETARQLLEEVEPLLVDPISLVRISIDAVALLTYPATCVRIIEALALLAIADSDVEYVRRAQEAVRILAADHPGARRPISDHFAAGIFPVMAVLGQLDHDAARVYVRGVAEWLLDCHDADKGGLGLASCDEAEDVVAERLLGGPLTTTSLEPRLQSYLATVVLDCCIVLGDEPLFRALIDNLQALRVVPTITAADERSARWRRGGDAVYPHPRVEYAHSGASLPPHHTRSSHWGARETLLLSASCRSRHYPDAAVEWIEASKV